MRHSIEKCRGFIADPKGAALPELAILIPMFLLLFFTVIDFGLIGWHRVMAEKAVQIAARQATVRPPVCSPEGGFPEFNAAGSANVAFGVDCDSGGATNICAWVDPIVCQGDATNETAQEIWDKISKILPGSVDIDDLYFTYAYDHSLGFRGGPFIPVVSVEIRNYEYNFVTRLGALAVLAGAGSSNLADQTLQFSIQSAHLPGEDLAEGAGG